MYISWVEFLVNITMKEKYGTILKSEDLAKYVVETSAFPRENEQLSELRKATLEKYKFWSLLNVPADEGQFLSMLLKVMNAKKTMEVGVFTGYSLLATALALPEDGRIIAVDRDMEAYEVGLPFIEKANMTQKIQFIQSDAMTAIKDLIAKGEEGTFDFIFVDADKENYINYHEQLLKLVRVGGIIAYDNTLWMGTVAEASEVVPDYLKECRDHILKLNSFLAADTRIDLAHLTIGDGISLCRRLR